MLNKKVLGLWDSVIIVVGIVVGVGIFKVPSQVAYYLPQPHWVLLAWLVGGGICFLGALCYAELATSFPKSGGNYIYLRESFGPLVSFLYGWVEWVIIRPGSIAAVSFISAQATCSLFSIDTYFVKWIAVSSIAFLCIFNLSGLSMGKKIQWVVVTCAVLLLLYLIGAGSFSSKGDWVRLLPTAYVLETSFFQAFFLALVPILWAFGGWHENTFLSGETRNPSVLIPKALMISLGVITFLYLAMNVVYLYLIPIDKMATSPLVIEDVVNIVFKQLGGIIVKLFILIASLATMNGTIITGGRITYALVEDHPVFGIHQKNLYPKKRLTLSIGMIMVLAITFVVLGTFEKLLFFSGMIVWLSFILVTWGLFRLRKKYPDMDRPYRVPMYPWVPLAFLLVCVSLFLNTWLFFPYESLIGLCLLLTGLPVYYFVKQH